ncbi:MAG: M56 family metallopeptidase, partial [Polyangiaceae bacterium]
PAARHVVWRAALLGPLASSALGHRCKWVPTHASLADEAWAAAAPRSIEVSAPSPWFALLAGCWAAVALLGVLLLARAVARQRRAFAPRTRVTHGACTEALERLAKRADIRRHVRLSRCASAGTPLVLSSREICLPERALRLDSDALDAVLAHELAHIERRDGLWLNVALLLQALLWFQPLNRIARAALQENAELAADDRAVELTGDALGLARTLTHVAGWECSVPFATSVAMARAGSPIVQRVARLVEAGDARTGAPFASRTPWFALAALTAIGACSPAIGVCSPSSAPQAARPSVPAPGLESASGLHL